MKFREVTLQEYNKLFQSILDVIKGREMTANQIRKELEIQHDISSVLYLMCDQGKLVRSKPNKYSLFNEYFPDLKLNSYDEMQAQTLLVQQYFSSFAPVTEEDVGWWIGLHRTATSKILNAIHDKIVYLKIDSFEDTFITLKYDIENLNDVKYKGEPTVNFLPSLGPLIMGYEKRRRLLNKGNYESLRPMRQRHLNHIT